MRRVAQGAACPRKWFRYPVGWSRTGGAVTRKWIDGVAPAALELIREPTEADVVAYNTRRKTALDLPDGMTSFAIEPAVAGAAVDARIGSFPVRPAVLRASGKMPNRYGIEVDRLTAIPGILSYERDRIVELAGVRAARNH